jgi:hypothetical protein
MSIETRIHPITTDLPSTLAEWRAYSTFPIGALWEHGDPRGTPNRQVTTIW